jgi:hypothetical protein
MLKKLIKILFASSLLLTSFWSVFALDFSGTEGFYSSIANNISKINNAFYTTELVGETGTKDKINSLTNSRCLKENLSETEIGRILEDWDLTIIFNKIEDSCKENNTIPIITVTDILSAISSVHNRALTTSKEKTLAVVNIDSTGIYTDWIEWNAPFDLIIDLKNIDKIIFAQKTEAYNWVENFDLGRALARAVSRAEETNKSSIDDNIEEWLLTLGNTNYDDLKIFNDTNSRQVYSSHVCRVENSIENSSLSYESINYLVTNIPSNPNSVHNDNNWMYDDYGLYGGMFSNPEWGYKKVNDDRVFPCASFFCINISFDTYRHQLLNSGRDMSIEDIIARSNEHLKIFAGTSLVQSKMTTNNFQLGLKDLNLPDIFHIWVVVTSKPVPILNVSHTKNEETKDKDKGIFTLKSLLEEYYKAYDLEYDRRNDLSIFEKIPTDRQIATASNLMTPTTQSLRIIQSIKEYEEAKLEKKNVLRRQIENETKISGIWNFERQFKELEVFNKGMKEYVDNLRAIIENMLKIPQDSWTT